MGSWVTEEDKTLALDSVAQECHVTLFYRSLLNHSGLWMKKGNASIFLFFFSRDSPGPKRLK